MIGRWYVVLLLTCNQDTTMPQQASERACTLFPTVPILSRILVFLTLRRCANVCAGFASIFCTSQYRPNFGMSTPYLSTSILPRGLSMSIRCSLFTFMNFLNLPPHLRPPSSKPQETCKSASFGISLETPSDTASPSFSPTAPSAPRSRSQTPARSSSAR